MKLVFAKDNNDNSFNYYRVGEGILITAGDSVLTRYFNQDNKEILANAICLCDPFEIDPGTYKYHCIRSYIEGSKYGDIVGSYALIIPPQPQEENNVIANTIEEE